MRISSAIGSLFFDNGFWCGLDAGFYPWDYLPYYAGDYYPYDYYTDVQPTMTPRLLVPIRTLLHWRPAGL